MSVVNTRQINGIIRTSEPTWSNLERLAEACVSWFTYDVHTGLYSWVINEAGNSIASLTEADIIGTIQISGSGLNNLYNSVEIEYPNTEIRDQPHYVRIDLPPGIRNAYEPDNTLQITSEFINNQPQAMYMADVTLRQSRLDRSVTIVMDYTKINLRAGDIIDLTSDTYAWTNKEFRIMRVREIEGDDGSLRLEFQLVEYDDSIYTGDISEFLVGGVPGIRGLGTIGKPGTPTVALTTLDSLPAQTVTTTVPAGVVDRMQFWAGNLAVTGNINTTTFDLYGTQASSDALSFTQGGNVTFTTTALRDGDWIWKTRATNTNGAGPFSDPSGNVAYTRNQAPNVIKEGTPIVTSTGNISFGAFRGDWTGEVSDIIQYTGNSVYRPMIYTTDVAMFSINGDVAEVAFSIPAGQNSVTIDTTTSLITDRVTTRTVTGNASATPGVAVYIAAATWNANAYAANGFSGLNWSDWSLMAKFKDEGNLIVANVNAFTTSSVYSFPVNTSGPQEVIALGYSRMIVPNQNQLSIQVDPVSGISTSTFVVPFLGNTVIFDSTGNTVTVETPGITASRIALSIGNALVDAKMRVDK